MLTILGSLLGGIFRLMPEVLKWLSAKDDRKHELAMLDKQMEADRARADMHLAEMREQGNISLDAAGLEALKEAIKGQDTLTGVGWADALSKSVRPVLTYWWAIVLSTAAMACQYLLLVHANVPAVEAVTRIWGPDEKAIVSSIFTFWFLDRVIAKRGARP